MDMNKLDEYEQDNDEEQFILVTNPTDNEPVEILLSKDGTCSLTTLEHAFPQAYGLKYKNPSTGAKRIVRMDDSGKNFIAPADGWQGKTFEIIFKLVEQQATGSKHKDKGAMMKEEDIVKKKTQTVPTALELGTKRKIDDEKGGKEKVGENMQQKGKKDGEESGGVVLYESRNTEGEDEGGDVKKMKRIPQTAVELKLDRSGKECVDLICMGLPYDLEEWALQAHFEQFGEVDFREIKRKNNGEARGFGFVRMARYSSQVLVLSQPKHIIGGRECTVRISYTDNNMEAYLEKLVESPQKPRLFIGGLNEEIYRSKLEEFFTEQIHRFDKRARINDIYYPRPFRGFAFLTIDSIKAAKELVRQSDFLLDGHHCVVTIASPKYQQQPNDQSMSQQPWIASPRQQPPMAHPYSMYEPPTIHPSNEMMLPRNKGRNGGGGIIAPRSASRYDEFSLPPRGGGGNGPEIRGHYGGVPPPLQHEYPIRFEPTRPDVFDLDSMETVNSFFQAGVRTGLAQIEADQQALAQKPGRGGNNGTNNNNVWMGGNIPIGGRPTSHGGDGGGNIPPEQVQAVLRQLPSDAVGTALKMLQSMIGGRQQENGRPDEL